MSENGVARLLLIIIALSSVRYGTPLECYVCNSVDDPACSSSLSGIKRSTCFLDETPETTLASTVSTTILDSITTTKTTTDVPTSITYATSTEDSSTNVTSTSDSVITTTITTDSNSSTLSTTSSPERPSTSDSVITSTNVADSTFEETTSSTVGENSTISATTLATVVSEENEPEVRVVRDADVAFACYTLTLIVNNETVTDRGCVVRSSSMCETLNEEKYPNHNLTTCETCTKDGCNSSPIVLSEISSLFLPFIMFFLTR